MSDTPEKRGFSFIKLLVPVMILAIIGLGGGVAYQTQRLRNLEKDYADLKKDPSIVAKDETKQLVDKVSKLAVLPNGEDPTVATVTDVEKLKDQPIFAKAQNGDKLLIYAGAGKAFLYRPGDNKLVDVIPVNTSSSSQGAVAGATTTDLTRVAIANGTTKETANNDAESLIKQVVQGVTIAGKTNAKKTDYTKTLVIDLSGKKAVAATKIANALKGTVVKAIPEGEDKPNADILVIVGAGQ